MTRALYLTADAIGTETGGGVVTANEVRALRELGTEVTAWSFPNQPRPWGADEAAFAKLTNPNYPQWVPDVAHVYSGTFTKTVDWLKTRRCKVTYTVAAHDIDVSKREHEANGLPFDYPHLTDPEQWKRYSEGYRRADVVVCPSHASAKIMASYGCDEIVVIPHGVDTPARIAPLPTRFSVAYLGQPGPDKGLRHLVWAWNQLDYKDAMLTIAGRGTEALLPMLRSLGGGSIYLRGEVDDVGDVYDACALYIQCSASEGFGIEVLEAMARGRVVLCSDGAGAADVVPPSQVFPACSSPKLADAIDKFRKEYETDRAAYEKRCRRGVTRALSYDWLLIRERYVELWRQLL